MSRDGPVQELAEMTISGGPNDSGNRMFPGVAYLSFLTLATPRPMGRKYGRLGALVVLCLEEFHAICRTLPRRLCPVFVAN
jgi:hypothetical protein